MTGIDFRLWLVAPIFFCVLSASAKEGTSTTSFNGQYVITDIVGYDTTSGGVPEAKRLLGQTVVITSNAISVGNDRCTPEKGFKSIVVNVEKALMDAYAMDRLSVGLAEKTQMLSSADDCTPVFRLDNNRIVAEHNGVVFRAIRKNADDSKTR